MGTTIGVVDFASGSVPSQKIASRRLGGKSLLEWIVRRTSESLQLDGVCIAVDSIAAADAASQLLPGNIPVHLSPRADSVGRLAFAADRSKAASVVRVCLTNPLVDAILIDRLVTCSARSKCDFACFGFGDDRPALQTKFGLISELFRTDALRELDRTVSVADDRRDAAHAMLARSNRFRVHLCPLPSPLDRNDVRLCVNSDDDWEHVHTILDALPTEHLDWRHIADLLEHHPQIRERMADLNRLATV